MTVNNVSPTECSATRLIQLLDSLTSAANGHAAQEDLLVKETRTRRLTLERRQQEALAALNQQAVRESDVIDTAWLDRWERTRDHHERRMFRLEKAERHAVRDLPRRTEAARAQWLGGLQRQRVLQERALAAESNAILSKIAERRERLAEAAAALQRLRRGTLQAFRGAPRFRKWITAPPSAISRQEPLRDPDTKVQDVMARLPALAEKLDAYRQRTGPRFFNILPPVAMVILILAGSGILAGALGFSTQGLWWGGVAALVGCLGFALTYLTVMKAARPAAGALASELNDASAIVQAVLQQDEAAAAAGRERFRLAQEEIASSTQSQWGQVAAVDTDFDVMARKKIKEQAPRLAAQNERRMDAHRRVMEAAHSEESGACEAKFNDRRSALLARQAEETGALNAAETARWQTLADSWLVAVPPLMEELTSLRAAGLTVPWPQVTADSWQPPPGSPEALPFAALTVDFPAHAGQVPQHSRLALPGPAQFSLPLSLAFPQQGSLLLTAAGPASGAAAEVLNNIILRLLAATHPGKASFTIMDPVGLGQNFGGLMHLSDYGDHLINHRIWTQRDHIDERLGILTSHIEKVIQMYLRNEYDNITEYNRQAGVVAEKYHYLVIADFPHGFSETAVKRLESILVSGPRCGVFTLMHTDLRPAPPDGLTSTGPGPDRIALHFDGTAWELRGLKMQGITLTPEAPPPHPQALALLHRIGSASIDAGRVEVPFSQISPAPEAYWSGDTTRELRIAIGRTGAVKHQILAIGKGTRQHALFAGKTGSGKSTLFHVIITNLALTCSPDEVEFYLIDFKKGVEFKCYANKNLPHARVVAIESDRGFALSVLHRLDAELKHRGDLFRQCNAQDLAGYRRASGPMPRCLLIIDEFQEFFTEDDPIAQTASLLLDRIVRQGRAFGIHVLLGSQTLGGAYSLARATLGQMTIRVALQCNEADAYLIMDDNNPAPRLLSRPGEGIYNDAAGSLEGNSPFQVVWLPDGERDHLLDEIHGLAVRAGQAERKPIVFEGNAPADPAENALLRALLDAPPTGPPAVGRCWLGAPNSIKGPTEAAFQRQSGQHLLIVGQREEASLTLLSLALVALAAQYPAGSAQFYFFHSSTPGTADGEIIAQMAAALPGLSLVRPHEAPAAVQMLIDALQARLEDGTGPTAPAIFVFIHGLHRFKKLRQEDDFSFSMDSASAPAPGAQFMQLISEGSSHGLHLLVSVDTFNNVNRSLSRKALTEFEMRVVFQMSANDSSSLIDSPAASSLGLYRALFYNEHAGTLETFRPYAPPRGPWLERTARMLQARGMC